MAISGPTPNVIPAKKFGYMQQPTEEIVYVRSNNTYSWLVDQKSKEW